MGGVCSSDETFLAMNIFVSAALEPPLTVGTPDELKFCYLDGAVSELKAAPVALAARTSRVHKVEDQSSLVIKNNNIDVVPVVRIERSHSAEVKYWLLLPHPI